MEQVLDQHSFLIPSESDAVDYEDIIDDVDGAICGPIDGFIAKYFPNIGLDENFRNEQPAANLAPTSAGFLGWFLKFFSHESDTARSIWRASCQTILEPGTSGCAHLFLSRSNSLYVSVTDTWRSIQVVGEVSQEESISYQDGLLNLCALARKVFIHQPTRLILHGFYISRSHIELWVFDRSGIYCSKAFDIRHQFPQFVNIIRSYRMMSDSQLGRSNIVQTDDIGQYIILEGRNEVVPRRIYLAAEPVTRPTDIVGGATTCYLGKESHSDRWSYAIKFKWRPMRHSHEDAMLNLFKKNNVQHVPSLVSHREIDTVANLRSGLRFGHLRRFIEGEPEKSLDQECDIECIAQATKETKDRFSDRTFICVVTTPVGRPLNKFGTALELLQALQCAIIAHRSLLQDAQILHQDVSEGNILITESADHAESGGLLIDFDVAIRLADQDPSENSITGTKAYMAIDVLRGVMHTYRHDLESFLYVFLWTVILDHSDDPSRSSKLRRWRRGTFDEIAPRKIEDMSESGFECILDEFGSQYFSLKPLARRLRGLLFPMRSGSLYTGTNKSPEAVNALYDGFIRAFEDTISATRSSE